VGDDLDQRHAARLKSTPLFSRDHARPSVQQLAGVLLHVDALDPHPARLASGARQLDVPSVASGRAYWEIW